MQLRKIESSEEAERKRKKNTLILSIVMIAILTFGTAGYFTFGGDEETGKTSDGVENIGNGWVFYYGQQPIKTTYSPEDAKNITVLISPETLDFSGKAVYIASDSDAALSEIYLPVAIISGRTQEACYGKCSENLPEKDCNETMVVIKTLNMTNEMVYQRDNCIFIEGGLNSVDAFIYRMFGKI